MARRPEIARLAPTTTGGKVSSGVYFYRLTTEAGTVSSKIVLLK